MLARGCSRSFSRWWGWRRQALPFATAPQPTRRDPIPSRKPIDGPSLRDFLQSESNLPEDLEASAPAPYLTNHTPGAGRKVLIETYGCQMNFSDTEIVNSVLNSAGYENTEDDSEADVVLLNTCAIRENAEGKIWNRLSQLRALRRDKSRRPMTVGVLGCMAERLKHKLLEADKMCDLVVGPDAYRDLPNLLTQVEDGEQAINVILSHDETYADITPVRPSTNQVSAYVSIMRGCNNMCSYCIVPFTRGRERSRDLPSIVQEVRQLSEDGYKEIVLLGQNVNSYNDLSTPSDNQVEMTPGFRSIVSIPEGGVRFAQLLEAVSAVDPEMRIRFTSPHPKDFPDRVLELIRDRPNICRSLHMPAQSGSTAVLAAMRRGHTREAYSELIERARRIIPDVSVSSDFISGFCGETEEDHQQTLSLLREVQYEMAFMFAYSLREKTHAHRSLKDDVPEDVKQRRLKEVIDLFYDLAIQKNEAELGKYHVVLVEKDARRGHGDVIGRTDTNKKVIIPKIPLRPSLDAEEDAPKTIPQPGDYVAVKIVKTGFTLHGTPLGLTTLREFNECYPVVY